MNDDPLARLRALCTALPDVTERLSHGEPTWFVGGTTFVMYADHHHDDRVAFWSAAPAGVQEDFIDTDPARFFRPPYVGHRGWLGVWLDVALDWDEVARLVADAHRLQSRPGVACRSGDEDPREVSPVEAVEIDPAADPRH